jgi:uncharacterized protein YjbI with pentapeptide repeats
MILRKYIRSLLSEMSTRYKRETGESLPKWYETFNKYAQQGGLYVHFSDFPKLGLFPHNRFDTPTGFYLYPLDTDKIADFGIDRRYAIIVRIKDPSRVLDIDAYEEDDLLYDIDVLTDHPEYGPHMTKSLISTAIRDAKVQIPAGKIWNITRVLAGVMGGQKKTVRNPGDTGRDVSRRSLQIWALHYIQKHGSRRDALTAHDAVPHDEKFENVPGEDQPKVKPLWKREHEMLRHLPSDVRYSDIESEGERNTEYIVNPDANAWSKIMSALGYSGVVDDGFEIIHENEAHQAVFFSVGSLELVDVLDKRDDVKETDNPDVFKTLSEPKVLTRANFEGHQLSSKNFNGFDLSDSVFRKAKISSVQANNANFSGSDFSGSVTTGLNARHSNFEKSVFNGVIIKGCNFLNSNFSGANLDSTTMRLSTFDGVSFAGANLTDSSFFSSNLKGIDFSGASLSDVVIALHRNEDLGTCNFTGVTFNNVRIMSSARKTIKRYDSWSNSENVRLEVRTENGKERVYEV